jgi:hypothetical protein
MDGVESVDLFELYVSIVRNLVARRRRPGEVGIYTRASYVRRVNRTYLRPAVRVQYLCFVLDRRGSRVRALFWQLILACGCGRWLGVECGTRSKARSWMDLCFPRART